MKKLTISGLVIFVVFFLAATLVWFVHDKDIYKRLKYNETFHQSSISKLNIDSYSSDITITQGSSFRVKYYGDNSICLLYTSPSPRDRQKSRMPSSA